MGELEEANKEVGFMKDQINVLMAKKTKTRKKGEKVSRLKAEIKSLKARLAECDCERRRLATVPSPEIPLTPCLDSPSLMSPSIITVASSLVLFMLGGVVFRRCLRKRRSTKEIADMTSVRIDS